jgi:hypothetical protein
MSEEDTLRRIEARLTRLEATLSQQSATNIPHPGAVVDPLPWPWGGGGWGVGGPWQPGRPHPIVDPAAYAPQYLSQYRYHPPYIVDPVPWPYLDPSAYAGATQATAASFRRPGPIMDPPPIDVSRFTVEQLEATLHSISAEKARLNSMENMVRQQLEKRQREE